MKIAILLYRGFTALDAVGPYEVLSRIPGASVSFVGKTTGPVRTDTGSLALTADHTLHEIRKPDILLVPGGLAGTYAAAKDDEILSWIRNVHPDTRWTTSVCTGSLILGAAGVLNGLQATSHWYARNQLSDYGAEYVAERFVVQGNVITAAGVSAGIDMALWLAGELWGKTVAELIQLGIEYDPVPPYDSGSFKKASPLVRTTAENALRLQIMTESIKNQLCQ